MIWKLSILLFVYFHIAAGKKKYFLFYIAVYSALNSSQILFLASSSSSPFRLPTTVQPYLYKIELNLSLSEEIFTGIVAIHVKILNLTESITFHSGNFNIKRIYIDNYQVESFFYSLKYDKLTIWDKNRNLIKPGFYVIKIYYNGRFSKPDSGLFKTKVTYGNKSKGDIIVTDLEPTYARTVFPCFDEPSFKAEFELSLIIPNNTYEVIANTKLKVRA